MQASYKKNKTLKIVSKSMLFPKNTRLTYFRGVTMKTGEMLQTTLKKKKSPENLGNPSAKMISV